MNSVLILGGIVAYEDGIKTTAGDQFSPTRKVRVELNFAVPEDPGIDASAATEEVLDTAISLVQKKLGIKAPTPAAKTAVVETRTKADLTAEATAKAGGEPATEAAKTVRRGPGRPPKAPDPTPAPVADAAAVLDDDTASVSEAIAGAETVEDWSAPMAVEITDKDLNDAVQKKNAVLKNPVAIRTLIGNFNPDPKKAFSLSSIAKEQRQTFLDKLGALA
jgi:hypothetical protein